MELQFHREKFERMIRSQLQILDRAITDADAANVTSLELTNLGVEEEDYEILFCFKNLQSLDIEIGKTTSDFWAHFPKMRELYIVCWKDIFDFASIRTMTNLESLIVSGGDVSDISYVNPDALVGMKKLSYLHLHEFGTVDLLPLTRMKQLKRLALGYADKINHLDSIASMAFLDELELDGLYVDNLDFLDALPDTVSVIMSGIYVSGNVDVKKWKRFAKRDICEISAGDQFGYIDLSALD